MRLPHGAAAAAAGGRLLAARDLYSAPPPARTWLDDNPTLLVSWWVTLFSVTIILFRLAGRYIRTERLFLEDKIMAASIVPLMLRMGFAHMVLRNGTNNTITAGLSAADIANRELGSRMVLAARVFYAMFLWVAKLTVTEFLHRLCRSMWKRSWSRVLNAIRAFLGATFVAVVIATLAECRPFPHYWQVVPDPGPQCRQAYAQLLTMGVADTLTDLVLVAFPVYIMFQSNMRLRRKLSLSMLFGLSIILVGITCYRVSGSIARDSSQQFRSLLASLEILAATFVSNALVLGSFMRDRGVKKNKFNKAAAALGSVNDSALDGPSIRPSHRRNALSWGSDTDLVGEIGMRPADADEDTIDPRRPRVARPAPVAIPARSGLDDDSPSPKDRSFPRADSLASDDTDLKRAPAPPRQPADPTPRRMSFFDVGGLLDPPPAVSPKTHPAPILGPAAFFDVGGLLRPDSARRVSPASSTQVSPRSRQAEHYGEAFAMQDFNSKRKKS